MEAIHRRLVMLKPMTAHASGHARLEAAQDGVEALVQARGLRAAQGRAYALDGAGAARELGAAEVNARGECTVSARLAWPLSRVRATYVSRNQPSVYSLRYMSSKLSFSDTVQ